MELKVPEVGESVREALLAKWFKKDGEHVNKDEPVCELETDKITLDLNADAAGILKIGVAEGTTIAVGTVVGTINEQAAEPVAEPSPEPAAPSASAPETPKGPSEDEIRATLSSPAVRQEIRRRGIDPASVSGSGRGGRITLGDLPEGAAGAQEPVATTPAAGQPAKPSAAASPPPVAAPLPAERPESVRSEEPPAYGPGRDEERKPMSPLRRKISQRLLYARQQTAMLTTFNEADMSRVKELRQRHREHFIQRHGAPLGLMPFFVRACVEALKEYPAVNASIDADDIVYHRYYDIGIAVGGEKGLVVPVLRDADRLRLFEIDSAIAGFAEKIRTNRISIAELEGGTFTISNGGIYGSMLSTPILNPPQSGVLGMHAIQDRPVVRDGQIVIRPMMFLALSYDHRIIDGREAVGFLKRVREYIEEPEELLLEG